MTSLVAAMIAGAVLGWLFPSAAVYAEPIARSFLKLIQSVIAPVLTGTLIAAFARGGRPRDLGRVGWKALLWFEASTTVAIITGGAVMFLLRPGEGVRLRGAVSSPAPPDFGQVIANLFPESIFQSMARGEVVPIVLFSIALGLASAAAGSRAEPFIRFCEALSHTAFQYTRYVMKAAAIGVGAAMAAAVGGNGVEVLLSLGRFVSAAWLAHMAFLGIGVLGPLLLLRVSLRRFWRNAREPFFVAFGTTSSAAAIPSAMQGMEAFGLPRRLVGLTLPLGISFNNTGSAMHLLMATLFVAQASGVSFTLGQLAMIFLTIKLTAKGVAGIPRANFVILASLFPAYGLPLEGLAMLLGVDAFIDAIRTGNNILANCVAPVVIARWEPQGCSE